MKIKIPCYKYKISFNSFRITAYLYHLCLRAFSEEWTYVSSKALICYRKMRSESIRNSSVEAKLTELSKFPSRLREVDI